ncbi:MAG: hypothetical protein ACRDS0_31730, partial [Pseudonocardiaceae bacterium]
MSVRRFPRLTGRWDRRSGVVAGVVVLALLGGCGGPGPSPAVSGPTPSGTPPAVGSAPAASSSGVPSPGAPEVNPLGDIPDNQVYVPYAAPEGLFTVQIPQGWARTGVGSAVVFTDKFNSVRIDTGPRPTAPDVASATAREVPQLRGSVPGFVAGQVRMVTRSAGPVVLITYQASSAPNAVTGKSVTDAVERYEFWRAGQEVVLTLSAPRGAD